MSANVTQILEGFYFGRFVESLETSAHRKQLLKMWPTEENICEGGREIKK